MAKPFAFQRRYIIALGLLLAPWLIYLPALDGDFVFDDLSGVVNNPAVQGLDHVPQMIRFWEPSPVSYRPARYFSYALDWVRGGGGPGAFHRTNVVLHGMGGVALYALLLVLLPDRRWAAWAAFLWLVHPLQSGAVAYVSGRKDLLCTLFYLLALLGVAVRVRSPRTAGRLTGAAAFWVCGLLAFLAKEMALTLPAVALAVDAALRREAGPSAGARVRAALAGGRVFYGLLAGGGAAGLVFKLVLQPGTKIPFDLVADPLRNLPAALESVAFFLRKAVWPWPQVADLRGLFPLPHPEAGGWATFWNSAHPLATVAGWAVAVLLLLAARRAGRPAGPVIAGAVAVSVVLLLPVMNLVPLNEPAAEHYFHLPLTALAVALVVAAQLRLRGRAGFVAGAVLLVILAGAAHRRSRVWQDRGSLWASVLAVHPFSDRAWNNLGLVRLEDGDRPGARQAFERSLDVATLTQPRTWANLVQMHRVDGDLEAALRVARDGLRRHADDPLLLSLAGGVLVQMGRGEAARPLLDRVATLPQGPALAAPTWRRDRALAHVATGDAAGGERLLREAMVAAPDDPEPAAQLGRLLMGEDRLEEALAALEAATALPTASAGAWRNLGVVRHRLGQHRAAARALAEAERRGDTVPPALKEAVARALDGS